MNFQKVMDYLINWPCLKVRFTQLLLTTIVRAIMYSSRYILSIAIVAMTTPNTSGNSKIPVYNWTTNSVILSSFYWSYAIIQFFASWIAHSSGPKWYLATALIVDSTVNLLTPVVAENLGPTGLMVCRVIQGLAQGSLMPLLAQLSGRWAPTNERTWMSSIASVGVYGGILILKLSSGYIAACWLGWPAIFYIYGSIGVFVSILWMMFGYNKPADHPRITSEERHYIESSLGQNQATKVTWIPWRAIFTSLPFWAIVIAAIGESWATTLTSTELPTYFSKVLLLDITSNGVLSTITYASGAGTSMISGPFIDYIINHKYISRRNARRIFNSIGLFVPALSLLAVTYVSSNYDTVVTLLAITYISRACDQHLTNIQDISPINAGILVGLANGAGQLLAIFAPIAVQLMVYDQSDVTLWRTVFMLSAGIFALAGVFYFFAMSGERQWWDSGESIPESNKNNRTESPDLRE